MFGFTAIAASAAVWVLVLTLITIHRARTTLDPESIPTAAARATVIQVTGYVWVASAGAALKRFTITATTGGVRTSVSPVVPRTFHGHSRLMWQVDFKDEGQDVLAIEVDLRLSDRARSKVDYLVPVSREASQSG
jgi:hypothetical protein